MLKKCPFLFILLAVGMASAAAHTSTTPNQDDKGCYLISDADELYGFAKLVNAGNATACGKLDADIVVNTNVLGTNNANVNTWGRFTGTTPSDTWTPIGTSSTPFQGSFDGQGHTISGLYFYQKSENFGLFGYIGGNNIDVTIKDLNISDSYFGGNVYVGSLVGHIVADGELTIENVSSGAAVYSHYDDGTGYIGGLIGYVENATANSLNLTITGVHNDGLVIGKDHNSSVHNYVGGLVGGTSGLVSVTVANSFNTGNITGSSYVGGLIGGVKNPTSNAGITLNITNAYNTGTINGSSRNNIGGLVGRIEVDYSMSSVEIRNCYNYGSVDGFAITNTSTTTLGQISFTPINCYYLAEESNGFGMSATDFADGTVFALLRSGEDGEVWYQYDGDVYPDFTQDQGKTVIPAHVATLHYSENEIEKIPYVEGEAKALPSTHQYTDATIFQGWFNNQNFTGDAATEIPADANTNLNFYAKTKTIPVVDGCYQISDADMLFKFAELVNTQNSTYGSAKAKLTADIVVNQNVLGTNNANVDADGSYNNAQAASAFRVWTPIGTSSTSAFKGSFNGQGHTISGLYFNNSDADNVGLFGYTSGAVIIEGVGMVDSYFRGGQNVGSIVAEGTKELTVTRSFNKGAVTGTDNVGGLVGKNGNVKFSYNMGSVTGNSNVGGLVGSNTSAFKINGSYNVGLVKKGTGMGNAVLGEGCPTGSQTGAVKNVYFLEAAGDDCLGAFPMTSYEFADGFVAIMLHNDRTVTGAGADIWGQVVGADKTPTLTGEIRFLLKDGCFEIANEEDLYFFAAAVNNGVDSKVCVKLTADIKVNENVLGTGNANIDATTGAYTGSTTGLRKWTPIGNWDNPFEGSFYGQGHTISGLYFNDTGAEDVGLFGDVYGTVVIDGVGLVDSYINAGGWVGGLVGYARGSLTISNSYNASSVTSFDTFGGLVGAANGVDDETSGILTISNSYNIGSLNGRGFGGGLVGYADALVVSNSYNAGAIYIYNSEEDGAHVGGIASKVNDASTVTNSFNYGTISYPSNIEVVVDDLVAKGGEGEGEVAVTNSYFIGESDFKDGAMKKSEAEFADGTVFALLRNAEDGEVWRQYENDVYPTFVEKNGTDAPAPMHVAVLHYSETDSVVIAYTEGTAKSLPTKDPEGNAITGWTTSADGTGDAITEIPTSATGDLKLYPKVKTFKPNAEGYYEIATADDLYKFAEIVNNGTVPNAKAKLIADICVNACGEGESVLGTDNANVNVDGNYIGSATGLREWTPIGNKSNSFTGVFDGQGHSISGLYFNKANAQYVGLFGTLSTATIKNVGVEDSYFKGSDCIGGILGIVDIDASVNIENVYNAAVVVGGNRAGGIIGGDFGNKSHVTNAYNVGMVLSGHDAGGIVGYNYSAEPTTIQNSFNYGSVSAGSGTAGALIGEVVDKDDAAGFSVSNSYYLANESSGSYGEYKTATEFADGTVLAALRDGEGGYVWVQAEGDKYPTIDIENTNAKTIVLDWTSADDSTTLDAAGYTDGAMVIVKDGKQFYADGAIYEGILSADQVAAIGGNKLYPISGVELETDDKGLLVAILDGMDREEGDTAPAIMIPFDLTVDKVIYKREMTAGIYKTVMLPFNVANLKQDAYNNYGFYRFTRMDENVEGYRYMATVYRVRLLQANMPYIMKNIGETDTEGIVFEGDGRITLNTVSSGSREFSATSNGITWSMKGVYENKVWETGDSEIGSAYLFAGQKKDGYKIGEFAKLGAGASLQPMRIYLLKDALAQLNRPGMFGSVNHYVEPESIGVRFVDDEEFDEGEETMVEKRITVIPTVIKSNRWYDMKGRALDSKPTAKGNYYYNGKRITIK